MKRYPPFKANVFIWSEFIVWYEAVFVRFEANSAIWTKFSIWSEFLVWYEANYSRDLKRNSQYELFWFFSLYSEFLLRYQAIFYCHIKLICIVIWSEICYLKRFFRSEANLYCCDMKRFSVRLESNSSIWRIFSILNEFLLWYEAGFSHDLKRNPLSEVIYSIWR